MTLHRLASLVRLPSGERALLVRAWGLFVLVDLLLRLVSPKRLLALVADGAASARAPRSAPSPSLERLAWLVDVAARHAPVRPTCLTRALVTAWLLRRQGIGTTLRIGVARSAGAFSAHAWLEHDGRVLAGLLSDPRHAPLLSARIGTR